MKKHLIDHISADRMLAANAHTSLARVIRGVLLGVVAILVMAAVAPSRALAGETYTVKVDKGYLALRTAPAYDEANEIGELYTGDVVEVKDKSNGQYWWVYSPKHGREGYVNADYLRPSSSPAPSSSYGTYTVKVDKGYLALRTAPKYDEANEIGELYTGDKVTVLDKSNGKYWWVYSPKHGREGYVNADYLVGAVEPEGKGGRAKYEVNDRISVTGVMRTGQYEYKGDVCVCDVLVLDEPVDVLAATYPHEADAPTWHEGVTSAAPIWKGDGRVSLAGKRLRVTGTVQAGSKRTPWMEADGTFHRGAGVLMIRDATYEVL